MTSVFYKGCNFIFSKFLNRPCSCGNPNKHDARVACRTSHASANSGFFGAPFIVLTLKLYLDLSRIISLIKVFLFCIKLLNTHFILRAFPTRAIRLSSLLFESSEREISKLSKHLLGTALLL